MRSPITPGVVEAEAAGAEAITHGAEAAEAAEAAGAEADIHGAGSAAVDLAAFAEAALAGSADDPCVQ